jgi:hypothetical protein
MTKYRRFPVNLKGRDDEVLSLGVKIGVWALNFSPAGRHPGRQFGPRGVRSTHGPVTGLSWKSYSGGAFRAILDESCPDHRRFFCLLADSAR